ncbi:Holliday junction resolvase Hjc [Candidatus Tiddalikarchaeum anstoanum]|nr:Holliday junction resolvase Hjc [Candidatus Tiddalikarchaeum anstoanum]
MNSYRKGANYERELIDILRSRGYAAIRVAGSGMARFEQPDIIAGNGSKVLAFECKFSSSDYKTINKADVNEFFEFSKRFGAKPFLAFRFPHSEWFFKLVENNVEDNVSVKKSDKFLLISEII